MKKSPITGPPDPLFKHAAGTAQKTRYETTKRLPIVVALPVTSERIASGALDRDIKIVGSSAAESVELRLDYMNNVEFVNVGALVRSCENANVQAICTCRIKIEGGNYVPKSHADHEHILKKIIGANPAYVDVELSNDPSLINAILDVCSENSNGTILSYHDFKGSPSLDNIPKFVQSFKAKLNNIHIHQDDSVILKLVFTARTPADNVVPLKIIDLLSDEGFDVVSFCMGIEGMVSRVTSVIPRHSRMFTGAFTYASLEQATAPGQIDLTSMISLLEPFFK
nr:type I 3-dehydroquinate dehydratase [Candidatus Sigynarchaeota archaeon]